MALAALWLAGRVLVLTPFGTTAAIVNAAFPLAIATAMGIPLCKARNVRNYFFVGLLALLGGLLLALHLAYLGAAALPARVSLQLALDVVLFVMAVMAGRVIPMFTNNGVPGAGATRQPAVEKLALGSVLMLFLADLLELSSFLIAAIALIGALAHAVRLLLWRSWRTFSVPLGWIRSVCGALLAGAYAAKVGWQAGVSGHDAAEAMAAARRLSCVLH